MAVVDPTCPIVKNLLILDSEGKRIAVKYYTPEWPTIAAQSTFEKTVWAKSSRTNARVEAEILMFDDFLVLYKAAGDLMFYITGPQDENELLLYSVLMAFCESVNILLREQLEKKTILENLDLALLAIDEIVDGGIILETDPQLIATRVTMRGSDGDVSGGGGLSEQSFSSMFASAKEHLTRSLLK